jgi:NADH:ubiquinone oxidoreductase subunit H
MTFCSAALIVLVSAAVTVVNVAVIVTAAVIQKRTRKIIALFDEREGECPK